MKFAIAKRLASLFLMQTPATDEYSAGASGLDGEELTQALAEENAALKCALRKEKLKTEKQLLVVLAIITIYAAAIVATALKI